MEAIPNEFSDCEFFKKIEIINCFRPDCTTKLLFDWLNVNLGHTIQPQLIKLLEYSKTSTPVLVLEDPQARVPSVDFIHRLYDSLSR